MCTVLLMMLLVMGLGSVIIVVSQAVTRKDSHRNTPEDEQFWPGAREPTMIGMQGTAKLG